MSSQRIIFTGITGLLGGYFLKKRLLGYEIFGIGNENIKMPAGNIFQVDITNKKKVIDVIKKIKPQVIIHAASIGNVDYCEKYPRKAYIVNVNGTKNIVSAAKQVKAKIIFLSSNAIYDGLNPPYHEKSITNPVDIYGKTKVEGENLIKGSGLDYTILRLITMYGWPQEGGRANPVTWIIDSLRMGQKVNVVNDVYNNHLYAAQAGEVIWKVVRENISGAYNIAGANSISRYDLAIKVANTFGLDSLLITPVSSDFFKSIAKRPKNTSFNTKKMEKDLRIKPVGIDEGLGLMKQEQVVR